MRPKNGKASPAMIGEEESVRIFDKQVAIQEIKHPTAQNLPKRFRATDIRNPASVTSPGSGCRCIEEG
jgi:hypothetical protein